jgi:hypothetical protein
MADQTLTAYNPSWRDQLAGWMLGDDPSQERARFVQGLVGSRGLGPTGASVSDFIPGVSNVLGAQEAAQQGDYKGAAMAAIPLPGISAEQRVAGAAEKEAEEAAQRGITAYHGSPHSFDKFDISKIGTGEGAQAYGHGLYFAESEPVAKSYRDALAKDALMMDNRKIVPEAGSPEDIALAHLADAKYQQSSSPWAHADRGMRLALDDASPANKDKFIAARQVLADWQEMGAEPTTAGSMYQVRINAEPQEFLDWDKPIGEQSQKIKDAFFYDKKPEFVGPIKGSEAYLRFVGHDGPGKPVDLRPATQMMVEKGIPGISYLDQGSRGAGEGTKNYVVFNDKLIDIMKKYGIAPIMAGGMLAGVHGNDGNTYSLTPVDHDPFAQ